MNIFIAGANGAVGKKIIAKSLADGHSVMAKEYKGLDEFNNLNIGSIICL
ncbi:hypothetical protein PV783_26120 [Chitinophaga sp. CC14]